MDKLVNNLSLGGDPEFFLKSLDTGKFVPSFYYIKGDKWLPTPISDEGHAIQCDNVMGEYNFPPCKTSEEFVKQNMFVQNYVKDTIAIPNNLDIVLFPFAEFDENDLVSEQAKLFGYLS